MTLENKNINKKLMIALSVIFLILLIWVIVFKCNYNEGLHIEASKAMTIVERLAYKMVPFEKFIEAVEAGGILAIVEIIALFFNVICFLPFGAFGRFFTNKGWLIILIGGIFSLSIEIFQLFSCWGGPDYIDLISNTLGVALGVWIYKLIRHRLADELINKLALWSVVITAPAAAFAVINSIINFPGF